MAVMILKDWMLLKFINYDHEKFIYLKNRWQPLQITFDDINIRFYIKGIDDHEKYIRCWICLFLLSFIPQQKYWFFRIDSFEYKVIFVMFIWGENLSIL